MPPAAPPLSDLDRRKARKVGTGKVEIEGRIDLHGMRQAEAHAALRRFLLRGYAEGRRWVLVITGKGAPLRRCEDDAGLVSVRDDERGVLKRNVPRWLDEPELRAIVIGFTAAAIRHGGEGALYVQLRRRDR
jgi:DNA-nicking Smr family endonuclease